MGDLLMRVWPGLVCLVVSLGAASEVRAHPVPFSYVDVRLEGTTLELSLVAHIIDIAHDLDLTPPEKLLEAGVLNERLGAIVTMLAPRLQIVVDGRALPSVQWTAPEALPDRQAVRLRAQYEVNTTSVGTIALTARMFPYDPMHQTFVNFYERNDVRAQAILDKGKADVEYFAATTRGVIAVLTRFLGAGGRHILAGPDHLLFLVGLLLLGGSLRYLAVVVSAFTLAHSLTLSLAALNVVSPPARIIEPAIALSIVYVGADNLMVRGGRDVRAWIALAFGLIHGFGFANVLKAMDLPRRALGWSLFAFNVGIEIG